MYAKAADMRVPDKVSIVCVIVCTVVATACVCCKKATDRDPVPVAELEIKSLLSAVWSYKAEYGHLPVINPEVEIQSNAVVIAILTAGADQALLATHNPRKIKFLDCPTNRMKDGQLLDLWGSAYNFAFRVRGNSVLRIGTNQLNTDFAIWSNGPNRKDENGNGDDVASWKIRHSGGSK